MNKESKNIGVLLGGKPSSSVSRRQVLYKARCASSGISCLGSELRMQTIYAVLDADDVAAADDPPEVAAAPPVTPGRLIRADPV